MGIVADDMTGAIDTAGVFASNGMATYVSLSTFAPPPDLAPEVHCVNTGTRYGAAIDAAERVREATRTLLSSGRSSLYKKIDSTLRGHVAAEIAAMLDAADAPFAFVAPAFPATGRTQRDGVLYVNDIPLAEAVEGQDKMGGAPTSSVVELLSTQSGHRCGLVPLADVESGAASVAARTRALLDGGCTIVTFDAVTAEHMRRIEAVLSSRFPTGLPVGSAGLASAIALRVGKPSAQPVPTPPPVREPVLIVSGSLNTVSLRQVDHVAARPDVHEIFMDADTLLDSPTREGSEFERILFEVQNALHSTQNPLLAWIRAPSQHQATAHREHSRRLNAALSGMMRHMRQSVRAIGGLVLVGGDTAEAVLTGFGAQGISMRTEVMPGISAGTVIGGDADSRPVIAKAGGFGDDDAVLNALEYLRGES
jgi:uncharacterized protein YgbK (DUF1537 family)